MKIFNDPISTTDLYKRIYHVVDETSLLAKRKFKRIIGNKPSSMDILLKKGHTNLSIFQERELAKELKDLDLSNSFYMENFKDNGIKSAVMKIIDRILFQNIRLRESLSLLLNAYDICSLGLMNTTNNSRTSSINWHRDGVGHRIKIFLPLINYGLSIPTLYFESSHKESCIPQNWEMFRASKKSHKESVDLFYSIETQCLRHYREISINWNTDTVIFIDTNGIHASSCLKLDRLNTINGKYLGSRLFLQLELMDITQAQIVHRYRLGNSLSPYNKDIISRIYNSLSYENDRGFYAPSSYG